MPLQSEHGMGRETMLLLTGDHIERLDDTRLRELIALLCEAEFRRHGHSPSGVRAGGDQRAKDGGIDVRAKLRTGCTIPSEFIPRNWTAYQVKAQDTPASAIESEMRPKGKIRQAIVDLAEAGGSYIIVSSRGSITEVPRAERETAMWDAVDDVPFKERLDLRFIDRNQIATWVRDNPGLIPWVRRAIGQELAGWKSYATWGIPRRAKVPSAYLLDKLPRVRDTRQGQEGLLAVVDAIARIRELLAKPGSIVRLVGLSGTGKTRLLAALFEDGVKGGRPLNPFLAHYADLADGPVPAPAELASHLEASQTPAIVIVDNCTLQAHRALAQACEQSDFVSAITAEFDVRDGAPENTDVFLLEPSSESVVYDLIRQRYPELEQPSVARIAQAAGGNAALALAIAGAVGRGENLTSFRDGDLFRRLFDQRDKAGPEVARAAQVCALVYSFSIEQQGNQPDELPALAKLLGVSRASLLDSVGELEGRNLVQRRDHWRALLPQALAVWLAKIALKRISIADLEATFLAPGAERLAISFSRRLGELDTSAEAQEIVRGWLAPEGRLGDPSSLNATFEQVFSNIAPVLPAMTLAALSRAMKRIEADPTDAWVARRRSWLPELQGLAYYAELFEPAAKLMMRVGRASGQDATDLQPLIGLFQPCLSGTKALLGSRLRVIQGWLDEDDPDQDTTLVECVRSLIKVECRPAGRFEFGATRRDFGYWPTEPGEESSWYNEAISFVGHLAMSQGRLSEHFKLMLANSFRELWLSGHACFDSLGNAITDTANGALWAHGWIAVRNTLPTVETKKVPQVVRLRKLEKLLRPKSNAELACAILGSKEWDTLDFAGDANEFAADGGMSRQEAANDVARKVGQALARSEAELEQVLIKLFDPVATRARAIGQGIADASPDRVLAWNKLADAYASQRNGRNTEEALIGFLNACGSSDPALRGKLLDDAVEDARLAAVFPWLQLLGAPDPEALERISRSLRTRRAAATEYQYLHDVSGSPSDFCNAVDDLARLDNGLDSAVKVVAQRLHKLAQAGKDVDEEYRHCARRLLAMAANTNLMERHESDLTRLVRHGLDGKGSEEAASAFAIEMHRQLEQNRLPNGAFDSLAKELLKAQPYAALNAFFSGTSHPLLLFQIESSTRPRILDVVPHEDLLVWASLNRETRVHTALRGTQIFSVSEQTRRYEWSKTTQTLLDLAPDRLAAYESMRSRLIHMALGTAGLERCRDPLESLASTDPNPAVRQWARDVIAQLDSALERERVQVRRSSSGFES